MASRHDLFYQLKIIAPLTMRILATIIVLVVDLADLLDLHIFFLSHLSSFLSLFPSFIFFVFVHYRSYSTFLHCNFALSISLLRVDITSSTYLCRLCFLSPHKSLRFIVGFPTYNSTAVSTQSS